MTKTTRYRLFYNGTGAGSALASLRIRRDGVITGIEITIAATGGAGAGFLEAEMSKGSSANITTNDAPQDSLAVGVCHLANAASTSQVTTLNSMAHPVMANDPIYLHLAQAGTAPATVNYLVQFTVAET